MMFFRRHVQKSLPTTPATTNNTNSTVSPSIAIPQIDTLHIGDDEHESVDNEISTTPTALTPMDKTKQFSCSELDSTSTIEHLSVKHPGLLRLFDSTVCTISIIISYLFNSKEPMVQQFLGKKLFDYSDDDVDFYLPQLINMYIHIPSISTVIHEYITTRCSQSVNFSLQCAWLLDAYIADQMKLAKKPNAAVLLLFDILYEKYKPKITYYPMNGNQHLSNHNHRLDEEENENGVNQDDDMKSERASSQDNGGMLQVMKKKGHQKSRSDVSGISKKIDI